MQPHNIDFRFIFSEKKLAKNISKSKGFTLIELLVAIVIIGALSSISLPGFLNQVAKARGSEAKSMLGSINRAQQSYHLQHETFTTQFANLDTRVSAKFYTYQLGLADSQDASATADALQPDLRFYSSSVAQNGDFFGQAICESLLSNSPAGTSTAPTATGQRGSCAPTGRLID